MKTAFKLTANAEDNNGNTETYFTSRNEAEQAIPSGFTFNGNTQKPDNPPNFKITEFNFPDLIVDLELGWENKEIVREYYYYK